MRRIALRRVRVSDAACYGLSGVHPGTKPERAIWEEIHEIH